MSENLPEQPAATPEDFWLLKKGEMLEEETGELRLQVNMLSAAIPAKGYVPAYWFDMRLRPEPGAACKNGPVIGKCDLRIGHSAKLRIGGNIGYGVFPDFRGHHYAARAVALLRQLALRHGMKYLYITCVPENAASNRTCVLAGGILEGTEAIPEDNEMYAEGKRFVNIYRFDL